MAKKISEEERQIHYRETMRKFELEISNLLAAITKNERESVAAKDRAKAALLNNRRADAQNQMEAHRRAQILLAKLYRRYGILVEMKYQTQSKAIEMRAGRAMEGASEALGVSAEQFHRKIQELEQFSFDERDLDERVKAALARSNSPDQPSSIEQNIDAMMRSLELEIADEK